MPDWCLQFGVCLFAFRLVHLVCLWVSVCLLSVFCLHFSVCVLTVVGWLYFRLFFLSVVHFLLALNLSCWFHLISSGSGCPYTVFGLWGSVRSGCWVLSGWVLAVMLCLSVCSTWLLDMFWLLCSVCRVLTAIFCLAEFRSVHGIWSTVPLQMILVKT